MFSKWEHVQKRSKNGITKSSVSRRVSGVAGSTDVTFPRIFHWRVSAHEWPCPFARVYALAHWVCYFKLHVALQSRISTPHCPTTSILWNYTLISLKFNRIQERSNRSIIFQSQMLQFHVGWQGGDFMGKNKHHFRPSTAITSCM